MKGFRKWLAALTLVCVAGNGIFVVKAQEGETQRCRELLLQYYCCYQEAASREIEACLTALEEDDPQQGKLWRTIMEDWDRLNHAGYDTRRALHDGLPQDDSLCIVVFGYDLKDDGSMQPELVDRLQCALNAARQYPGAYIAVTGGETSDVPGITEAGQMAAWLRSNGVADSRLILETQALSTTENARNLYSIFVREYPTIRQTVVVTSDYHAPWAAVLMQTVSTYESMVHGTREIPVAAGASCVTGTPQRDTLSSQAWGIGLITGTDWNATKPELTFAPQETEFSSETDSPEAPAAEQPRQSFVNRILGWLFDR